MQKKEYARNDPFFVKKRQLFRKADQLHKYCKCDIFIIVNNRETAGGKIFAHQTDPNFDLEQVTSLVLRDLQREQKNKKYRKKYQKLRVQDFDAINQNVEKLKQMGNYMNELIDPNYTYVTEGEEEADQKSGLSLDHNIDFKINNDGNDTHKIQRDLCSNNKQKDSFVSPKQSAPQFQNTDHIQLPQRDFLEDSTVKYGGSLLANSGINKKQSMSRQAVEYSYLNSLGQSDKSYQRIQQSSNDEILTQFTPAKFINTSNNSAMDNSQTPAQRRPGLDSGQRLGSTPAALTPLLKVASNDANCPTSPPEPAIVDDLNNGESPIKLLNFGDLLKGQTPLRRSQISDAAGTTASTRVGTTPNMKNEDAHMFEFKNIAVKLSPKSSASCCAPTQADASRKDGIRLGTQQIRSIKLNYLHVPGHYSPKVFEMDDDIILQYETGFDDAEPNLLPTSDPSFVDAFRTNMNHIAAQ